jgi:hypothetical protein
MSKALVYGIIAAVVTVSASVTYFFPIISDIHSYLTNEGGSTNKENNSIDTASFEPQNSAAEETIASFKENPSVNLENNSLDANKNANSENNPLKTEILQDEVPVNKSF